MHDREFSQAEIEEWARNAAARMAARRRTPEGGSPLLPRGRHLIALIAIAVVIATVTYGLVVLLAAVGPAGGLLSAPAG